MRIQKAEQIGQLSWQSFAAHLWVYGCTLSWTWSSNGSLKVFLKLGANKRQLPQNYQNHSHSSLRAFYSPENSNEIFVQPTFLHTSTIPDLIGDSHQHVYVYFKHKINDLKRSWIFASYCKRK